MNLRQYQIDIAESAKTSLLTCGVGYLSMECRTGKTLTALEALRKCDAKSVLFITKKKAMTSVRNDYNALRSATVLFDIDIINHESAHKIQGNWDYVVIDEAHCLGAFPKPSKKTVNIRNLCKGRRVLFLSGTPTPESYSQLYHQFWVSEFSPWSDYPNFYKWAKDYVTVIKRTINGYSVNDYSQADEAKIKRDLKKIIISYTQEEAGFEAEINERVLTVPMQPRTRELLKTIYRKRVAYFDYNIIVADTPAKLMSKMHQISSGTSGGVSAMTQETAEELNGRFTAMQISMEAMRTSTQVMQGALGGLIAQITPAIAVTTESSRALGEIRDLAIQRNDYLYNMSRAFPQISKDIADIKKNTGNLSKL